jgi:processive 1,2-diacylglycerol beta-glucosyltransferase
MIELKNEETGESLGSITEAQLQFLIDHLEVESDEDRDYYLNRTTLDALAGKATDPGVIELLRRALGERGEIEIEWSRE